MASQGIAEMLASGEASAAGGAPGSRCVRSTVGWQLSSGILGGDNGAQSEHLTGSRAFPLGPSSKAECDLSNRKIGNSGAKVPSHGRW